MRQRLATEGLANSFLSVVDPPALEAIRQRAFVHHHPGGDMIVTESDHHWTGIVLAGMARVFISTTSGRQVTLRHARTGGSIGVGALLGEGTVSAQAVTPCDVLSLDTEHVLRLARENASLAFAIAEETSLRLRETYREMAIREAGSVRQRLARQILHFAGQDDPKDPLALEMSHEEIADAIGSAREVVSRHLARFQAEDMLALERGRIRVVDPIRLDSTARQLD